MEKVIMRYVPAKDESLSDIAHKFHVSEDYIIQENPQIKRDYIVSAGQEIRLSLYYPERQEEIDAASTSSADKKLPDTTSAGSLSSANRIEETVASQAIAKQEGFPMSAAYLGLASFLILSIICLILAILLARERKRDKEEETAVAPELDEDKEAYEARCRTYPKDIPAKCWYRCGAKGLKIQNIPSHHQKKCPSNPDSEKNKPPKKTSSRKSS